MLAAGEASGVAAARHGEQVGALGRVGESLQEAGLQALSFGAGLAGFQLGQSILENLVGAVVEFPEKIQQARITFETFTGSASAAAALIEQIQGLGTTTPFSFGALADTAKTLVALGTPAEEVAGQVRDIAAATAAVGRGDEGLQGVAMALARIQEVGVVDGRIMRQLTTDQIPAWLILSEAMHKSVPELQNLIKHGQITSDVFLSAFHQWATTTAGDALARQTNTVSGSMVVMTNALQEATAIALEPFTERVDRAAASTAAFAKSGDLQRFAAILRGDLTQGFDAVDTATSRAARDADIWARALSGAYATLNEHAPTREGGNQQTTRVNLPQVPELPISLGVSPVSIAGALIPLVGMGERVASAFTLAGQAASLFDTATQKLGLITTYTGQSLRDEAAASAAFVAATNRETVAVDITATAVRRSRADFEAQKVGLNDADVAAAGYTAALGGVNKALAEEAALTKATQIAQVARAETHDTVAALKAQGDASLNSAYVTISATDMAIDAQKNLDAAARSAGAAVAGIGQNALTALPGLSALDLAIASTQQDLAKVQLQIEEKVLARMETRPNASLGGQEALLQEKLKVEQLQKAAGYTVAEESIKISNANVGASNQAAAHERAVQAAARKHARGHEDGAEWLVGGSGGPDSQWVPGFYASPDETISVRTPEQLGGPSIVVQSMFGAGAIVIQTAADAANAGQQFGAYLKDLLAGASSAPGRAHRQLAGVR